MAEKVQELTSVGARAPKDEALEVVPLASVAADVYQRLAAPFETTFRDLRGGVEL
jgi:hypothetical protein